MILDFGLRFLFMLQFDEHYAIGGYSALLRKVSGDSGIRGFRYQGIQVSGDSLGLSVYDMLNYGNAWEIGKYLYITNGTHDGMETRIHYLQPTM